MVEKQKKSLAKKDRRGAEELRKRFVEEYIKDQNGTRSAIAAGYSEKSAHAQANYLLKQPEIKAAIAKANENRLKRVQIDADYVLKQLQGIHEARITEILKDDGTLREPSEWPDVWQRMVVGIEVNELFEGKGAEREHVGFTKKVKLMDRTKILEMLGKHINVGAFKEKVEHTASADLMEAILAARKRRNNADNES